MEIQDIIEKEITTTEVFYNVIMALINNSRLSSDDLSTAINIVVEGYKNNHIKSLESIIQNMNKY